MAKQKSLRKGSFAIYKIEKRNKLAISFCGKITFKYYANKNSVNSGKEEIVCLQSK